jgi:hypothetical protein
MGKDKDSAICPEVLGQYNPEIDYKDLYKKRIDEFESAGNTILNPGTTYIGDKGLESLTENEIAYHSLIRFNALMSGKRKPAEGYEPGYGYTDEDFKIGREKHMEAMKGKGFDPTKNLGF